MKRTWIFAAGIAFISPTVAAGIQIATFDAVQLKLNGSSCTFGRTPRETVLASDWSGKFWLKIDGKMVELVSHNTDDETDRQLSRKRWHENLRNGDLAIELSLVELGRGDDTAAYSGYLKLRRHGSRTRIAVTGGCSA